MIIIAAANHETDSFRDIMLWVKSMSSSRNVLAAAPISAAVAAMGMALLNMIEKPKTPQMLMQYYFCA